MIVDVPITYAATVVALRERKPRRLALRDHVAVEIAEATSDDAPTAFWWCDEDVTRQVAVRSYDGCLYRPYLWSPFSPPVGDACLRQGASAAQRPCAVPGSADWCVGGRHRPSQPIDASLFAERLRVGTASAGEIPATSAPPVAPRLDEMAIRSVESSHLDAERARWQAEAASLLSVDGVLFRKAPMPLIVVKDANWHGAHLACLWDGDIAIDAERAYAVTEWDAAADALRALRGAMHLPEHDDPGCDPVLSRLAPRPDILRADLIPALDRESYVLRGGARSLVGRMERRDRSNFSSGRELPVVTRYDRPVMLAYARLRDACAGAPAHEVVGRLRDLAEACEPHGTLSDVAMRAAAIVARAGSDDLLGADADALAEIGALP